MPRTVCVCYEGDDDGSPNNTMHITRWHNICRTRITKHKKRFIVFLCAMLRKMLFKNVRTMRLIYINTTNTSRDLRECNKILKYYIWPNEHRTANCPLCFVLFTQYPMFTEDIFFFFLVLLSVPKCQPNGIEAKI